jgi:alanyl-tRNA synthetase
MKEAVKRGALAFFGDKYNPDSVRMIEIPHFSTELCGGTHVPSTGVIGTFKITDVTALSAGHRRITAVTGPGAIALFQECFDTVKTLSQEFKVKRDEVLDAVNKQQEHLKHLQTHLKQLKKKLLNTSIPTWQQQIELINDLPFLCLSVDDATNEDLKDVVTQLMARRPGFYCVTT